MKGPCTVEKYLVVLTSKLTQYDVNQSAREAQRGRVNIYRLGHLLEASQKVQADVRAVAASSAPEALDTLRRSLAHRFDPAFPPVRAVTKQIDKGTCSLVGPRRR